MVQLNTHPTFQESEEFFKWYPFPLSYFQKYAIHAITKGQHSLSCVPTGSGKTLPAQFAIEYYVKRGKRVIYTSPIKALSNQKYYEFTNRFPSIRFGILTGDMKVNPDADVLIMTAEILQNKLLATLNGSSYHEFDIDFEKDLGCVIHDEVHMINDKERGHVWETILLATPSVVPTVMLSATLEQPERFAAWLEDIHPGKEVYVASCSERVVPLHHYGYFLYPPSFEKKLNQQESKLLLETHMFELMSPQRKFTTKVLDQLAKVEKLFCKYRIRIHRNYVMNELCGEMYKRDMFPAVCFVLSRKNILTFANEITTNILPLDTIRNMDKECEQILRSKLVNAQEFLHLPEYHALITLLRKGIAIHHSGMIPIFRELVELLFEKGHIQLLFATETFSVGLNMPIRSTIFTNMKKFDGHQFRAFHSYEFTQAAGRAGRRGMDTQGNVIHLLNLYQSFEINAFYQMLHGMPPSLRSQFKYSYRLVLTNETPWIAERSLQKQTVLMKGCQLQQEHEKCQEGLHRLALQLTALKTTVEDETEYERIKRIKSKKKRHLLQLFEEEHPSIEADGKLRRRYQDLQGQQVVLGKKQEIVAKEMETTFQTLRKMLEMEGFLDSTGCTRKGVIAIHLEEVPSLVLANLYPKIRLLTPRLFLLYLSCFSNFREESPSMIATDHDLYSFVLETNQWIEYYEAFETREGIVTGEQYNFQWATMDIMEAWIDAENENDMEKVYQLLNERNVFIGEWLKLIMKVNHMCRQWQCISETIEDFEFLQMLEGISSKLLKSIATNTSLYV